MGSVTSLSCEQKWFQAQKRQTATHAQQRQRQQKPESMEFSDESKDAGLGMLRHERRHEAKGWIELTGIVNEASTNNHSSHRLCQNIGGFLGARY